MIYGILDGTAAERAANHSESRFLKSGDTIEALAASCGMDVDKLAAAVAECGTLGEGPFFAVQVLPGTLGSFGGLKINTDGQVLSGGNPIPGLYAAGEVANGEFFGLEYPASGSSISMSMTFGKAAGAAAAASLK